MLYYIAGPTCRGPSSMYAPPLRHKREAIAAQNKPTRTLTRTGSPKHSQTLSRQGNTIHSGRRVLRSGGPNHSKSLVFIVFLSEIELGLANPPEYTPSGLGRVPSATRLWFVAPRHPHFDGSNPRFWKSKCEDYFKLYAVSDTMKATFASLHMDDNVAK